MATHSSVLAWRIPGTREPGGLPSMGSHRVRHDWSDLAAATAGAHKYSSHLRLHAQLLSCVWFFVTLWAVAHQVPLSMGFSRQEYWSGLSFPPPGDLPDPGIEPMSSALADMFFTPESPGKPTLATCLFKKPISSLLTFAGWIQLFFQNKLLSLLNSCSQYLLVDYTIPAPKPPLEVLSVIRPLTFLKNWDMTDI